MNTPPTDSETLGAVHEALASVYRRQVVQYLANVEGGVATVGDLGDYLRDHEGTPTDRKRIRIRLHHVALPKLAALGFVNYDDRSNTVRYREHPVLERELQRTVELTAVS